MSKTKRVSEMTPDEIKSEVKKTYAKVAERTYDEQKTASESCCGSSKSVKMLSLAAMGYEIEGIPDSAIESYAGCGNPVALASLKEGEYILDLGSGAGLDLFAAAKKVGETGRVIGVDMTKEMIEKAEQGAKKLGFSNVEFRLGDIENLPLDDKSVDVIISNCVINLAPDKAKVFQEAFRVLRPGGRMMISDIVLEGDIPETIRDEIASYTGCLGGAILADEYLQLIHDAGFEHVEMVSKSQFGLAHSAKIAAYKPE